MGLFEKFFGSKKELEQKADSMFKMLNAYTPRFTSWSGKLYESELVRAAINARAMHFSKMSVRMVGSALPSLQTKMKQAPNEFQTWSQLLYRMSTILDVHNTCFLFPVIDKYDMVTGIATALPDSCEFVEYNGTPYIRYHFANGKTASIEMTRCGIMTKYQYRNDMVGDTNAALNSTMNLIDMQTQGITEGVRSAATYRFMAKVTNFTKPEDLAKERKRFSDLNLSSNADGGGLLLFPNSYSDIAQVKAQNWTPDADQMKLINQNVFDYFGVNEKILTNAATPDELDAFWNGALEPLAIQLAEVMTKMLYTLTEQGYGNHVEVSSDRLQYMSVQNKVSLIQTLGDRGMLTINEARHLLNYPPVDGGDAMMPIRGEYYNSADEMEGDSDNGTE